jgi:hypothetical protein
MLHSLSPPLRRCFLFPSLLNQTISFVCFSRFTTFACQLKSIADTKIKKENGLKRFFLLLWEAVREILKLDEKGKILGTRKSLLCVRHSEKRVKYHVLYRKNGARTVQRIFEALLMIGFAGFA